MLLLFLLPILLKPSNCDNSELLLTIKIQISGRLTQFESAIDYSLNLEVSTTDDPIFSNKIKISNFSFNSSGFTPIFPFQIKFNFFVLVDCISVDNSNNSCEVANFPNGKFEWDLKIKKISYPATHIQDIIGLFVVNGTIFKSNDGTMFTAENNCTQYENDKNFQQVCSTDSKLIEISTTNIEQCNRFKTDAKIIDVINNVNIDFIVNHTKIGKNWDVKLQILNAPTFEYSFYFGPNIENAYCIGNNTLKNVACIWEINILENANFEMVFTFDGHNGLHYAGIIVGEVIYAFEKYYKSINVPYSLNDPCWKTTASNKVPFSNGTYNATFCCTTFDGENIDSITILSLPLSTNDISTISSIDSFSTDSVTTLKPVSSSSVPTSTTNNAALQKSKTFFQNVFFMTFFVFKFMF